MQNYNSKLKIIPSICIFVLLLVASVSAAYAQTYKLELVNPSQTISAGNNFQVKILINTGGIQTINGDTLVVFEPLKVTMNSAQTGNFFTYFSGNNLGGVNNKYLVSSWEESISRPKSSNADTLFATLDLNAKAQGSTTLSFECKDGNEADTNINQASDSKDIVKCSDLKTLTVNIGAGAPTGTPSPTLKPGPTSTPSATLTPRPTSTPIPTNTPRPTVAELPRSGTTEITIVALGIGALLTVFGILIIL